LQFAGYKTINFLNIEFYRFNGYFCGMFSIRKVKTKSGDSAIEVVQYVGLNKQSGNSNEVVAELSVSGFTGRIFLLKIIAPEKVISSTFVLY
jgi:hypothetical protein